MIVVVAGPRDYDPACKQQVFEVLDEVFLEHLTLGLLAKSFVLRHGVSGNVDTWANEWGLARGVSIERFRAEWNDPVTGTFQPWAGPKRNKEMATTEPRPDLWLAFWDGKFQTRRGGKPTSGTHDGIVTAAEAGVRVRIEPPRRT